MQVGHEAAKSTCLPWVVLLSSLALYSCVGFGPPLDLSTMDPSEDQWRIAEYYSREAAGYRQKAEELHGRMLIYASLFGAESEWVNGTRLLAQSYEDAAFEHERLAEQHMKLAEGRPAPRFPTAPHESRR
ncbi:hypothetical protein [Nitrospira sp. Nam74]